MAIETIVAAAITALGRIFSALIGRRQKPPSDGTQPSPASKPKRRENQGEVSGHWHGVLPENSKYEFVTETRDSIPAGLQSFSFEYGPHGHAYPLTLKGAFVRAEIQFTCRVTNPYKAMFAANEYALNVLPPKFLTRARAILEQHSLTKLRASRQEVAHEIVAQLSPQFEELGFSLESVTIGAVDKLEHANA